MKYPKLKQTALCQIVLYSPALIFFFAFFLLAFFDPDVPGILFPIFMILGSVGVLFYLFFNFCLLLGTDLLFMRIRFWKKDRLWYWTERNGTDRQTAEKRLAARGHYLGRKLDFPPASIPPLLARIRYAPSTTLHYKGYVKFTLIYSVDTLDCAGYDTIIKAAASAVDSARIDPKKFPVMDPKQRNAPPAYVASVVILADQITEDVPPQVRKRPFSKRGYLLPCVADFHSQRYYFNGMGEPYILGREAVPKKNVALTMMRKLLFGHRLPLKNSPPPFPAPHDLNLELSLWSFLRQTDLNIWTLAPLPRLFTRRMKAGEFRFRGYTLYYKGANRVAEISLLPDPKNEQHLTVILPTYWRLPHRDRVSPKNRESLRKKTTAFLNEQGYTVEFAPETSREEPLRSTKRNH